MAEEETTANPQAGTATNDKNPQPQAGDTSTDPQAGDDETISKEKAKDLRSEAANLRKRLKEQETILAELKTFKEQVEQSQLSETEKRDRATQQREKQFTDLQQERDRLAQELRTTRVNAAVQLQAIQQGIDPKLATRLFDQSALEYDDDGTPSNTEAVFKAMVKEFNLTTGKGPIPTAGGATSPARSQSANPALSWDVIGKMTPAEYQARAQEIQQWIAANPWRYGQRR